MADFVVEAVENYLRMERYAKVIELMESGRIRAISLDQGMWRVDTARGFYMADTLGKALDKALAEVCDGRS